ncbi:MAG: polysaccharide pyruvyl transferase family protein [Sneathiellaceae bacterium]
MNVTITNTTLLNAGDAAIAAGTLEILRRAFGPDIAVTLRDSQAEAVAGQFPDYRCLPVFHVEVRNWTGRRWAKFGYAALLLAAALWRTPLRRLALMLLPWRLRLSLRSFAESDLLLSAGGTYLVPHYRCEPKLLELLVARLAGRPYVLFTQSLGPFAESGRLMRIALKGASAIFVRDARSFRHLRTLGIAESRIHECADAAFAMRTPALLRVSRPLERWIGISVRDWPHFSADSTDGMARYLAALTELVEHLVQTHDAHIVFISTCQGASDYWTDDSRIADSLVGRISDRVAARVSVDRAFRRPEDLRRELGRFDLFVATRMHAAILALQAGVPVLPIAYEFKTVELFDRIGMGALVQPIETISGFGLCRTADRMLRNNGAFRRRVAERIRPLQVSAFSAAVHLARIAAFTR